MTYSTLGNSGLDQISCLPRTPSRTVSSGQSGLFLQGEDLAKHEPALRPLSSGLNPGPVNASHSSLKIAPTPATLWWKARAEYLPALTGTSCPSTSRPNDD